MHSLLRLGSNISIMLHIKLILFHRFRRNYLIFGGVFVCARARDRPMLISIFISIDSINLFTLMVIANNKSQ